MRLRDVIEDLKEMEIRSWKGNVQDRKEWVEIVLSAGFDPRTAMPEREREREREREKEKEWVQ